MHWMWILYHGTTWEAPYLSIDGVSHSVLSDSVTLRTVALQAPLPMEFSRQEYWSGLIFPSPVDIPTSGIEPRSPALQADSLPCEPPGKPYLAIPITCFLSAHLLIWSQDLLRHRTLLMFQEEIQPCIVKPGSCQCRWHRFDPWVGMIPWRKKWQLTPVFLPGKFHGQRNLAGYSPWGHKAVHDWENRHTCIVKSMKYLLKAPQFSLNTCGSYFIAQHCIFKCVCISQTKSSSPP